MGTERPVRVLHVIESYGSGSLTAAVQYVRSTPDLEHHLLRRVREDYVPFGESELFATVADLPASRLRGVGAVRRRVRALRPDVVHAHSSFAGLFTRLAVRAGHPARTVYTPHCFVFERTDLSRPVRLVYLLVEWLLALNTSVLAGCSAGETERARGWRTCRRVVHVPNVVPPVPHEARTRQDPPVVVSLGRISPQKDPAFFVAVLEDLRRRGVAFRAVWIGGGRSEDVALLERAGVEVSGWVARERALALLAHSDLYVHTAAWEGFPMSVLEARSVGLPVVVRDIAAFVDLPADVRGRSAADVAALAEALLAPDGRSVELNGHGWQTFLDEHTVAMQRSRLLEAYADA